MFIYFLALSFNSIFNFFLTEAAQYECSRTVVPLTTPLAAGREIVQGVSQISEFSVTVVRYSQGPL